MGQQWTNSSVLAFADGADPIERARSVAEDLLQAAASLGLEGPPLDVARLAAALGARLRPTDSLTDARTVNIDGETIIEYNPSRPRGRLRFSLAHELAHTRFPDVAREPRYRTELGAVPAADDNWEVELVCNIIAAELLLPEEAVGPLVNVETDIDFIMETRRRWDVSTEALLRRLVEASPRPLALLVTSARAEGSRVDYLLTSPSTKLSSVMNALAHGDLLEASQFRRPSAVGQTLHHKIRVGDRTLEAQTVGTPPFPGSSRPRAMTLIELAAPANADPHLSYVTGDLLTELDTRSPIIFAHVVSDSTRSWSRYGAAAALARAYPDFPGAYRAWTIADASNLALGNVHFVQRQDSGGQVGIASIVAQEGYGPGKATRLRYDALEQGLTQVAEIAGREGAKVHVPRIGAGQAGGRWDIIETIIRKTLTVRDVDVIVHTLRAKGPEHHDARS
ncbi:ImmA/IrrE family metallo-endopeptidase [Leifsonia sp. 71-9]|uniref:ImmA/IrrE family metallo-endopeptidase n=1 Tax=Leifsonia sp. 71-9 TaxID=1895934 RepID=UPI0025C40972|nr:ImmA/IrrE family metallo-endopeptidase [Leifsonia sp. 71-9]